MVSNVSRVWKPDETLALVFEILLLQIYRSLISLIFPFTLYGVPVWNQASQCDLKWYYDKKKSFPFLLSILKAYSLNIQLVKF